MFDSWVLLLPYVMLVSLRVSVALAILPAPLGSVAPTQVRAALGVILAIALSLPRLEAGSLAVQEPGWLGAAALTEALVGLMIGLTARLCVAAAEVAGDLAGTSMGLGFAQIVDPASGHETTATTRLLELLAVCAFFASHGHHVVIAALGQSLDVAPPGVALSESFQYGGLTLGAHLLESGLRIASPVVGTMLVVQLAVALTSRAAPRLQVFSLSFVVAAGVGLLTLTVALPAIAEAIATQVRALPAALIDLLHPD